MLKPPLIFSTMIPHIWVIIVDLGGEMGDPIVSECRSLVLGGSVGSDVPRSVEVK